MTRTLRLAGCSVGQAGTIRDALILADRILPHLVITDGILPDGDGLDLCRRLRRRADGGDPFVLVLLNADQERRLFEAFLAGVDDYVTKPFHPRALLSRLSAARWVLRLQSEIQRSAGRGRHAQPVKVLGTGR